MKTTYKRIEELDREVAEGPPNPANTAWLGLKIGLAIATALIELTSAVDDVARAVRQ